MKGSFSNLLVLDGDREAVAELAQRVEAHLLLLVRDHLAFAGLAHAVALDGLGEDDGGPALALDRRLVGRVDLRGIVPAARQFPDALVRPVGDHRRRLRIPPEELLADVGAALRLEVLVFAVDAFLHELAQPPGRVLGQQLVPVRAPHHLDDVPAGAAEAALELLDDLAVAAHRPVEPLQVAVDDEDQVVELLAAGEADRAEALRLVHLAVAAEHPHVPALRVGEAARVQVLQEPRLVDGHDRPEPHRHGRELPELGHEPGVRIGRETLAVDLLAEVQELLLREPTLEVGARVDAGRGVALHEDEVAAVVLRGRVPEVHEAGVVERRRRLERGDVAAELGGDLVGAQDDGGRVPADDGANAVLDFPVARVLGLFSDRNAIHVGRIGGKRHPSARPPCRFNNLSEHMVGALRALERDYGRNGVGPLARGHRLVIELVLHDEPLSLSSKFAGAGAVSLVKRASVSPVAGTFAVHTSAPIGTVRPQPNAA